MTRAELELRISTIISDETASGNNKLARIMMLIDQHRNIVNFLEWYKKLTITDKCTIHPPEGSGASFGIYELSDKEIVNKYNKRLI